MSEGEAFDPSDLTALVVDHNHFQRKIAIDQLRMMGFRRALGAEHSGEAWDMIVKADPDLIFIEWLDSGAGGLDFVRRIRTSEDSPNRAVPIFMLTNRGAQTDVETARKAGVDGYMRKPISALALQKRVKHVVLKPQPFIVTDAYVGPCRRRRQDPDHAGPMRRLTDASEPVHIEEEDIDLRAQMARACVAALDAAARAFQPGDARAARKVFKAAQDLSDVAEQIGDLILGFGCREMMRYLQAQGATSRLDPEVVRTHVAALHQLAHLHHSFQDERNRVAQSLKRMVDKKLRQAAGD